VDDKALSIIIDIHAMVLTYHFSIIKDIVKEQGWPQEIQLVVSLNI